MVAVILRLEDVSDVCRDLRLDEVRRWQPKLMAMPADELARRIEIELRGSPLFRDVPTRRGREKPAAQVIDGGLRRRC